MSVETRAHKRKRSLDDQAGVAFPSLPFDVVVSHILREQNVPVGADLARIRGVSLGMRDAVVATGLRVEETYTLKAALLGHLSTLKHMHSRGRLLPKICRDPPFVKYVCANAAMRRQLEVLLQWLRTKGCPWYNETRDRATKLGYVEND